MTGQMFPLRCLTSPLCLTEHIQFIIKFFEIFVLINFNTF